MHELPRLGIFLAMRITGGIYRGRRIDCPPGVIRPAMDCMRESLFSILGDLSGESFLDLFSGSGCVGIEAASRGAATVHLVEKDKLKLATIKANISFVKDCDIKVFLTDVMRFLSMVKMDYNIVYADPPFPMDGKVQLANLVQSSQAVRKGGLFIIHYPEEEKGQWPQRIGDLALIDERSYGRSHLKFFRRDE